MRKVRPRPLPSRSSLVICVCLLTCSSPASAFKPQPLRTPSTAAAAHGRPQTTHTRAESVDIREPVSQPWRVSTARYPLIGWPSWGPKLHEAVIVERRDANAAAAGPAYLLFDFIPVSATKISTVTTLFRGQTVPGMIREKVSERMLLVLEKGTMQTPTYEGWCWSTEGGHVFSMEWPFQRKVVTSSHSISSLTTNRY